MFFLAKNQIKEFSEYATGKFSNLINCPIQDSCGQSKSFKLLGENFTVSNLTSSDYSKGLNNNGKDFRGSYVKHQSNGTGDGSMYTVTAASKVIFKGSPLNILSWSVKIGRYNHAVFILDSLPSFDLESIDINDLIASAIIYNHPDIVKLLVNHPKLSKQALNLDLNLMFALRSNSFNLTYTILDSDKIDETFLKSLVKKWSPFKEALKYNLKKIGPALAFLMHPKMKKEIIMIHDDGIISDCLKQLIFAENEKFKLDKKKLIDLEHNKKFDLLDWAEDHGREELLANLWSIRYAH